MNTAKNNAINNTLSNTVNIARIVIACDSFKGSLTSAEVADAAAAGILDVSPDTYIVKLPVADGGEGTTEAIVTALGGEYVDASVHDPLMRVIKASYGIVCSAGIKTAIIDMASASGLPLLSKDERNPSITTSYGTGELILDAYNRGCRRFIIGIGGSATNDGGKGMLKALGVKFLDKDGTPLSTGGASLRQLASIDMSDARTDILKSDITVICDVNNPLCGPRGASAIYGPQKGADPDMVLALDAALANYAKVIMAELDRDVSDIPGSGAAGGLGASFLAFSDARLTPGIEAVLDIIGFDDIIADADLVITGEGRVDSQTLFGKVPAGVLAHCKKAAVPLVAIAGCVADRQHLLNAGFAGIFPIIAAPINLDEAMKPEIAAENVRFTCSQIVNLINNFKS